MGLGQVIEVIVQHSPYSLDDAKGMANEAVGDDDHGRFASFFEGANFDFLPGTGENVTGKLCLDHRAAGMSSGPQRFLREPIYFSIYHQVLLSVRVNSSL